MTDQLNVEPAALHRSGHRVSTLHTQTQDTLSAAHSQMDDAVSSGWIGASADAMRTLIESMRAAGQVVADRLDDHSQKFHESAAQFTTSDTTSSKSITAVGSPLSDSTSSLNLDY